MSLKYLAPVVAIAGHAVAQSSCSAATTTIQNNGDASGLAGCTTFSGSIAIATGTTENIELNGIRKITGDLIAHNVTEMSSISADSLETIEGAFSLKVVEILTNLNFPQLTEVDEIDWDGLPQLQGLSFTSGVKKATSVSIINTQLNDLEGINLEVVEKFSIQNNDYLNEINMQLGNVSDIFELVSNGRNVSLSLPNLIWANRLNIANASSVELPSLASVNETLGLYSNFFESMQAPNLTDVGGTLAINNNNALTNISFPQITIVSGGLTIQNNTELADVSGFPNLETVGGALDMYGNSIEKADFPKLKDVRGAFNLQSEQDLTEVCPEFEKMESNSVIKGKFTCRGEDTNLGDSGSKDAGSSPSGNGADSEGSSGSGGSDSDSAAATLKITGATAILGAVAVLFGLL
ncbi:hypothetical protein Q7P37_008843 [Cladosporium fusiforme]